MSLRGPLDALVADLKIFPQKIVNVRVKAKPPLDSLPEVSQALAEAERALGNSGRVVLRYSGTEPLARVMVEAEHEDDVRRWTDALAEALRTAMGHKAATTGCHHICKKPQRRTNTEQSKANSRRTPTCR